MDIKKLQDKITQLTLRLQEKKPQVYQLLAESPETIPIKGISNYKKALEDYYETLKSLLKQ